MVLHKVRLLLYTNLIASTLCYFSKTHYYLGNLLYNSLGEDLANNLSLYIVPSKLGQYSSWADTVKRRPEYTWSKHHHYVDLPSSWCNKDFGTDALNKICNNDCIFTSILNITNDLAFNKNYLTQITITENIKFLVHHFQDLHQPLHVYGDARGGNNIRLNLKYNGRTVKTSLHAFWDKIVPEHFTNNELKNRIINVTNVVIFDNITNYKDILFQHIKKLFRISCKATKGLTNGATVNFEEYFKNNKDTVFLLFQNYLNMLYSTLMFVFG